MNEHKKFNKLIRVNRLKKKRACELGNFYLGGTAKEINSN